MSRALGWAIRAFGIDRLPAGAVLVAQVRTQLGSGCLASIVVAAALLLPATAIAQSSSSDGWVEEPGARVEGQPGRAYLDPASVHRGTDGMVYFSESTGVTRDQDIGKVGVMLDAYDCAKNIKYMCVQYGNWRNDAKSTVDAARDPALPVYRQYLCGDAAPATASPKSGAP